MHPIVALFDRHANAGHAEGMAAYMKQRFAFYGLPSPKRRELQKPFLQKDALPPMEELEDQVRELWSADYRELHYFAIELLEKYQRQFRRHDLALLEHMAGHQQWWDSIDAIAVRLMGSYFKRFPDERHPAIHRWLAGDDFWLQRCGILFQLKYKAETDTDLLVQAILPVRQSNEFFIQKAIGWALREYRKTDAAWVDALVETTDFKALSRREAWKHRL